MKYFFVQERMYLLFEEKLYFPTFKKSSGKICFYQIRFCTKIRIISNVNDNLMQMCKVFDDF